MATEYPPLGKSYVISYSNNDRDYPIIGIRKDPRVDNYKIPDDLSPHPDSTRYPNHIFTGANPTNSDERVLWVYEILPSPWVPFTRYDDDLGPIQGRRRSVKNEGQIASLTANKRVTYEAREGSAIVYTELEETWSIKTDDDGNSLFPVRIRDFYDASRGAVEERRQLFVPTGEEVATLENVNGIITQTSYEPYNEYLSFKIIQTYAVDGPQLVGQSTDNDGQLVTVTTQRKASDNYTAPQPTATKTVEVSREDAKSLVERVVDTPEVFSARTLSRERPDPIPQKFRVLIPTDTEQESVEGTASLPTLESGELSKSEQQQTKFVKRISTTSRDQVSFPKSLTQKATDNDKQIVTVTETVQFGDTIETPTATKTIQSESLGDGNYVVTTTEVPEVFSAKSYRKTKDDLTPQKFRGAQEDTSFEETVVGIVDPNIVLAEGEFSKSEQQINKFLKRISTTSRDIATSTDLSEIVITRDGQIATRTLRLSSDPQSIQPDALLVDGSIEALGDGRTIKTETRVDNVFSSKSISLEKPDVTPEKWRAAIPSSSSETTVAGIVNDPIVLSGSEISKSEQQVTEFIKRTRVVTRDPASEGTLTGQAFVSDLGGGIATITEKYGESPQISATTGTVSAEKTPLGDGKFVTREVVLPNLPTLKGQEYDETLDIVVPFTRKVVSAYNTNQTTGPKKQVDPRDVIHSSVTEYDFDIIESQLDDFYWECPDLATVNLPDILLRATLFLQISQGADQSTTSGDTYYVKSSSSSSINGDLVYDVQSGYSGLVPAVRSVFFIKRNESNITNSILAKLAQNGLEATIFPYVKTINHTVIMTGGSQQVSRSESASIDYDGTGSSSQSVGVDFTVATQSMKIPPTLHPNIPIKVTTNSTLGSGSNISGYPPFSLSVSSSDETTGVRTYTYPSETTISIPATDPPTFPLGKYVTSINASPYRFGYTRVETIVVDITGVYTQMAQNTSSTPAAEQSTPPAVLDRFSKIQLPSPWQAIAYVGIPFTYKMLGAGIWVQSLDVNTGSIPSWASYNESTGVLSGTPTQAGTYNISVTAFNNYGGAQIATFKLIVAT